MHHPTERGRAISISRGHSKDRGHLHSHGRGSAARGAGSSLWRSHIRCSLQYLFICRDEEGKEEYGKKEKQPSKNEE